MKSLVAAVCLSSLALAGAIASPAALAADAPARKSGDVLVDSSGMTLYTFDKDAAGSGKSACSGPCIGLWPALAAEPGAKGDGEYTVVSRDDGTAQWARHGKPLYRYSGDKQAGDRNGDNVKNVWHVVKD